MNLRSKLLSAVSTATIGISLLAATASAATSSTTANLAANTPIGCTVAITAGTAIDFGTFTWDGTAWTGTPTPGSITVLLDTDFTPGTRTCPAIQVQGTGLANGGVTAFPAAAITVGSVAGLTGTDQELIAANTDVALGGASSVENVSLDASQVNNEAPAGVYSGSITVTVASGI